MAYHEYFNNKIELDDDQMKKYLHGEEVVANINAKGYGVVTRGGYPLGGVKIVGSRLKNLYPKGLRV
jgi:NOL1/NOP2/fmu family ribosome biogenesis protein